MIDPMLMEFDREASMTKKVIERVPQEKIAWRPHAKSMSIGGLAQHLATLPGWMGDTLLLDGYDVASAPKNPEPESVSQIVAKLDENVKKAKSAMAQLDDAKAMGEWKLSMAGKTLIALPRIGLLRSILLNHSCHHRGQLTVYLRLLDVPVPSLYGPSADENPFG